jgi:hypothetical protein
LKENGAILYETGNTNKPTDYDDFKGWLFERYGDDWSSCAYFYLNAPSSNLPEIAPYMQRIKNIQDLE